MDFTILAHGALKAASYFTIASGLLSALYWYKAARVTTVPLWVEFGLSEPVDSGLATRDWIMGILQANQKSAKLNEVAALWTAGASFFGAMAAFLSLVP